VPPLVLASRSPRRQEALAALGVPFQIAVSAAEEVLAPLADPTDPVPIAAAKAADIAATHPGAVVLAGDTIVVVGGQALGKPASPHDARAMLRQLRGRQHAVRPAVIVQHDGMVTLAEVACPLRMRRYSDAEIDAYVDSGEPLDCAGAYDVHRRGGALVERVEGCFSTVVGLPIAQAARMLTGAGIAIPRDPAGVCTALYGRRCLAGDPATRPACLAAVRDATAGTAGTRS
jgi:septum formation protein